VEEPELPAVAARVSEVDPCEEIVSLDSVSFDSDEAEISTDGATILGWIVDRLSECENQNVKVEAHTDATATEDYNLELSDRRADAVVRFLIERGIDAERITSEGFGESRPIAPNDNPEGRSLNRRVDLIPVD
jgi:OOP family OmpA-OmpF porin